MKSWKRNIAIPFMALLIAVFLLWGIEVLKGSVGQTSAIQKEETPGTSRIVGFPVPGVGRAHYYEYASGSTALAVITNTTPPLYLYRLQSLRRRQTLYRICKSFQEIPARALHNCAATHIAPQEISIALTKGKKLLETP